MEEQVDNDNCTVNSNTFEIFHNFELDNYENSSGSDDDNEITSDSESEDSYSESSESASSDCDQLEQFPGQELSEQQVYSLSIVSFILRHKLTGSAVADLLSLLKVIFPGESSYLIENVKYEDFLGKIDHVNFKVCHYCPSCGSVFPENPDVFKCAISTCGGFRYKGNISAQTKRNRQPCCFFVVVFK